MAKRDKAGIYIDAQLLLQLLYDAQFEMDKRDRAVLSVRMLSHAESIISNFALAYNTDDKIEHINKMLAHFEVIKVEIRFAIDRGMFKKPSTIAKARELIVKMEEGIAKWRAYIVSTRQDQHTGGADRMKI